MPSTVGSAPLPAHGGDDADDADDGGPRYEVPAAGDTARTRRVARRLGVAVLDRLEGAATTAAGRGRPRGPGESQAVPGADGAAAAAAAGRERLRRLGEKPAAAAGRERLRVLGEGLAAPAVRAVGAARDGVAETASEQMSPARV